MQFQIEVWIKNEGSNVFRIHCLQVQIREFENRESILEDLKFVYRSRFQDLQFADPC